MVLQSEKSFPRGGNEAFIERPPQRNTFQLFAKNVATKKGKQKRGGKKKQVQPETFVANSDRVLNLSYKSLVEGMVLLGHVRRIEKTCMSVSLPGHICGRVSMSDVSKPYSRALQALTRNSDLPPGAVYQLGDMFQTGQPLVVCVEALGPTRTDVRLTLDPSKVQGHWTRSSLKEGVHVVAAVRSTEDHVYVMDVGLPTVRAYLKKTSVHKYLQRWTEGRQLGVGQVLHCVIVKADVIATSTTLELSAEPGLISENISTQSLVLDSLIPGVRCDVTVSKVVRNGLEVRISDSFIGHIHRNHLLNPLDRLEDYHEGQDYPATLLYMMPTVKLPYLSLSSSVCPTKPLASPFSVLDVGAIVENCVVISVDGQGIVLQLGNKLNGLRGYVSHRRALGAANRDPARSLLEELRSKYPVGSLHRCRVLDYNYADQIFICSTEKTLLKAQYIHPSTLTPGEHIWCEMDSIGLKEATVYVLGGKHSDYKAFTAYAPLHHLSDVPLRHPEKKFTQGSRWKARVLSVQDLSVKVTLKPSLVMSDLPVLTSYKDAHKGQCFDGTVYRILENGMMIKFYGNIAGFIPRVTINTTEAELESMFYFGQTVRCYVLDVKLEKEGLFLTLEPPLVETHSQNSLKPMMVETHMQNSSEPPQEMTESEDKATDITPVHESGILHVGQQYKITVIEVNEGSLSVSGKTEGSSWTGEIPAQHLTDCSSLADQLLGTYTAGKKLKAYCWDADKPILTLRPSAIKFFKAEQNADVLREGLRVAKSGHLVPCSVASVESDNLLLQVPLPNNSEPLRVPLQMLGDRTHSVNESMIQPHKGLIGCVKFSRKKNPKLSVKLSDVCSDFSESAVELLQSYILGLDAILHHQTSGSVLSSVSPGDKVGGVVRKVSDDEIIVKLKPSRIVCSVSPPHQPKGRLKTGSKVEATVLYVDHVTGSVDITMRHLIMARIALKQDGKLQDGVHVGSVLRAQVVLVKEDFVLVTLFGNKGQCKLAYMPARCHMNELFPDTSQYCVGDKIRIVIKRVVKNKLIGVFKEVIRKYSSGTDMKDRENVEIKVDEQSNRQNSRGKVEKDINGGERVGKKEKKVKLKDNVEFFATEVPSSSFINGHSSVDSQHFNGLSISEENKASSTKPEHKVKIRKTSFHESDENDEEGESETAPSSEKKKLVKFSSVVKDVNSKTEEVILNKKRKHDQIKSGPNDSSSERKEITTEKENNEEVAPALEVGFIWNPEPSQLPLMLGGESKHSESSSEDENEQVTKKKRLSVAEKKELARQEEARIRDIEMKLMNDSQNPQTADDFDRLVLASPNSSALWVQYMAYHLQATEIEKARSVAEKAFKTISFREEAEKLNVWVALLNLENLYGTTESLNSVLKEAVQMNDAQTVYLKMLQIYCTSNKAQEAEQLVNIVCKKFKDQQDVWVQAGMACMKLGLVDKAHSLLQRALASLDKKLHVAVITKYAQLEQQWGSAERAQTLMEQILTSYPQRVDVWSSYVDMLVKSGSIDIARQVLERAVFQKLSTRKMKTLYKKYLDFEEKHGTPEGVSKVRQMALDYVEAITSKLQD